MLNITNHQGNANQNHSEISPHTCQNGYHQKDNKRQVLMKMWKKGNPSMLLVGMQFGTPTKENSREVPQKIKDRTTIGSSNSTSGYI